MVAPIISVVLPCYNSQQTLETCLQSLAQQTWTDFEVIAVNDGSHDDTAAILQSFARGDMRFRVMTIPHGGVVNAMNAGMVECQGSYIARMDSDDVCLPDRFRLQKDYLDAHPDIGLVGGKVRFGGDSAQCKGYSLYVDWTNTLLTNQQIRRARFVESPFANPSIMFRKDLVSRWGAFYDGPFPEDYEFILRWLGAGVRMAKVEEEVLIWNDPPTRISRTDPRYDPDAFYRIKAKYLAEALRGRGVSGQVAVLGAGRVSRRRASMLEEYGVRIASWIDIDPAKIDRTYQGRPVRGWHSIGKPGDMFLVSFIGNRGARTKIVDELTAKGWVQGQDYILAA